MHDIIEKKYVKQLPYMLGAMVCFATALVLAGALYNVRAARPTAAPIATNATVIVFELGECAACDEFRRTIGRPYNSGAVGAQAPLRYYDISDGRPPKNLILAHGIGDSPTTVVFDIYGREAARIGGVPATLQDFEKSVKPHVKRAAKDLINAAAR